MGRRGHSGHDLFVTRCNNAPAADADLAPGSVWCSTAPVLSIPKGREEKRSARPGCRLARVPACEPRNA
jgi:hypothetical protein